MNFRINLNADLGESRGEKIVGDDAAMLDVVRSANIACGFHAGDPLVMKNTVTLALARGVSLGAHPSFPDLEGFGRRPMTLPHEEVEAMVAYQIGALAGVAASCGGRVSHVKPHGALNNMAAVDFGLAAAIARAIKGVDEELIFLAPSGSEMVRASRHLGLRTAAEVFADRNYDDQGNLVSRGLAEAFVHDPAEAAANVLRMVRKGVIRSVTGKEIPCGAHSVCVHGDNPNGVATARAVRAALEEAEIAVVPLTEMGL